MIEIDLQQFLNNYGLTNKFENSFLQSPFMRFVLQQKDVYVAGGIVRRLIDNQSMNSDVDLFFNSEDSLNAILNKLETLNAKLKKSNIFNSTFELDNQEIQLIHIDYYDSMEKLLDSFDFTICQFGIDNDRIYTNELSLFDLGRRRLLPHKITYPLASMRRVIKYTKQGFYACEGCLVTIMSAAIENPDWGEVKYID